MVVDSTTQPRATSFDTKLRTERGQFPQHRKAQTDVITNSHHADGFRVANHAIDPRATDRLASVAASRTLVTRAMAGVSVPILILSTAGVFGLTSSLVNQRTRKLAIRAAIGARPATLRWVVLKWSTVVFVSGMIAGATIFYFMSRLLVSFLVGVSRSDALAALSAGLLVGVAVFTASAIPAYRAGRVDLLKSLDTSLNNMRGLCESSRLRRKADP